MSLLKTMQGFLWGELTKISKTANNEYCRRKFTSIETGFFFNGRPILDIDPSGKLQAGKNLHIKSREATTKLVVGPGGVINIGDSVGINYGGLIVAAQRVDIGNFTVIAPHVMIMDTDSHGIDGAEPNVAPISIGKHVWIASRVIVLRGVTVGDNSIIGAGSVVTKNVSSNSIVAGCPARKIGSTKTGYTGFGTQKLVF